MYKLAEASRVLLAKRLLLSAENSLEEFVSAAHILAEHTLLSTYFYVHTYSASTFDHSHTAANDMRL